MDGETDAQVSTGLHALAQQAKERMKVSDQAVLDRFKDAWGRAGHLAAARMAEIIPSETDLNALANAARTATSNYLDLRDGRKGSLHNTLVMGDQKTLVVEYRDDWRG